ncbi:MAG: zinc ribbon domain-containing protein, partial [Chloroflexi bacterium]|nr:zinc ribbon domain-containing protein [Chloroflexota bacterium]
MPEGFDNFLLLITIFVVVTLAAFWLAIVIWAYRDMRSRSRDPLAHWLVAIIVFLLNAPGLFIYILLRPRATLAESYERSLEEEALLQEIEERPTCPGCSQRVQHDWQACPHCHH